MFLIFKFSMYKINIWAFMVNTCIPVVKNLPGNARDVDSMPGLGDHLEKEMSNHSSIHAWKIPWTEEPDELQSIRS